jgi:hypothetical protein
MTSGEWFPKDARCFNGRHKEQAAIVIAYGTSLQGFDWTKLEGRLTVGLNNSIQAFCPTYWIFIDRSIVQANKDRRIPPDLPIIINHRIRDHDYPWKQQTYGIQPVGFPWDPRGDQPLMKKTVATTGLTYAWLLGARKILLLGVDCYALKGGVKGDRPTIYADGTAPYDACRRGTILEDDIVVEEKHDEWVAAMCHVHQQFKKALCYKEDGLEVYNGSPRSRVTVFPYMSADEFLERFPS